MLVLSGVKIKLKGLKVSVSQDLNVEDKSGLSSSTDSAEVGNKGKIVSVSGLLPFSCRSHLSQIFSIAGAKNGDERTTYRIVNRSAAAAKVTQVRFQGALRADEDSTLAAWSISFDLAEHISVAEREQKKEKPKAAKQQTSEGTETPAKEGATKTDAPPETIETSWLMEFLKSVDDALA